MIRIKYRWIHSIPKDATGSDPDTFRIEYDGVWMGPIYERTFSPEELCAILDTGDIRIIEMEMVD